MRIANGSGLARADCRVSSLRIPDQDVADPAPGKAENPNARVIKPVDAEAFRGCLKQPLL